VRGSRGLFSRARLARNREIHASSRTLLLEIKFGSTVRDAELQNLRAFKTDIRNSQAACFYTSSEKLISHGIPVLPWQQGMREFGLVGDP